MIGYFFFFNDTATTEIYTLSLHDALPILMPDRHHVHQLPVVRERGEYTSIADRARDLLSDRIEQRLEIVRSEEHTSELQSRQYLVCRLLLEKKKTSFLLATTSSSTPINP